MTFLPFTRPHIDEDAIRGIAEVLRSGWIASGPQVLRFEAALSAYVSGRPVRVTTSATQALEIALRVAGIAGGAEVILPAMSFVASANVIVRAGAKPVFVDIDPHTRNVDLDQVERVITPATRAIMPVHFAGLPVDIDRLYAIAQRHRLRVIEDAAHAIGSAWQGRRIGATGDLVCFSFHPNKNITTIEGGAIVASDPEEVLAIEQHRFHGISKSAEEADVLLAGGKANMPDVCARLGLSQLPHLDDFNERRRQLAALYFESLAAVEALQLPARGDEGHSWHMFAPLLALDRLALTRRDFIGLMADRRIGVGVHYPAIHLFSFYRGFGYREGDFPNAERVGRETVTLPLFPAMTAADIERVCTAVREIVEAHRR
ncbi:MAG TPA: DegT/DnrJ/EryC1/StrS aminotransferase family protein [Povalibacter sp.]|nr:DegT/DnrJ/EryC1/StrS aminotransferase family protein [Povalibacter sp.]